MNEIDAIEASSKRIQIIAGYLLHIFTVLFWMTAIALGIVSFYMLFQGVHDYSSGALIPAVSAVCKYALEMTIALIVIWIMKSMFGEMSHGAAPFSSAQAHRLRAAAVLLLLHALVEAVNSPAFLMVIGLGDAALGATIGSASAEGAARFIPINAGDIVLAIVLFCAALIVEYGSLLQKLSDDTL